MHGFKNDLWKISLLTTSVVLLLMLVQWASASASAANAHEETSVVAMLGTVTVQAIPTVDATGTALSREQQAQQIKQLQLQNDRSITAWFWSASATLGAIVAALLAVVGVLVTAVVNFRQWTGSQKKAHDKDLEDREAEQERRAEERFQAAVTGLGDEKEGAMISAAITLRTFLHPDYKQFHAQIFDLAVANLRIPRPANLPLDPDTPLPYTSLNQALSVLFIEAFQLVQSQSKRNPQLLNAKGVRIDNAYLMEANLRQVWMPGAFLREADLSGADLSEANLSGSNLRRANLIGANLSGIRLRSADLVETELCDANLSNAKFRGANLRRANLGKIPRAQKSTVELSGTRRSTILLGGANLSGADLSNANLSETDLSLTDLSNANLSNANLSNANLSNANLSNANLSNANLSNANLSFTDLRGADLTGTDLRGISGLDERQLAICKAKGAKVDEDPTSSVSLSTLSPPMPPQSNDEQTSLTQGSIPPPDPDESNTDSSQQEPEP